MRKVMRIVLPSVFVVLVSTAITYEPAHAAPFIRGDADDTGVLDINDPLLLLTHLFSSRRMSIPDVTCQLRFTFKEDACLGGCPGDQDADRNANIDYFLLNGELHEAENWDRDGGTDPSFPGAGVQDVTDVRSGNTVTTAILGNENDFVEYALKPCGTFMRGDVDGSGNTDISDPINNLRYLLLGSFEPKCMDTCDFNDSGVVDLSDPIGNLRFLVLGMAPPPSPWPDCGADPTTTTWAEQRTVRVRSDIAKSLTGPIRACPRLDLRGAGKLFS